MEIKYILACETIIVDRPTNQASLINIFDVFIPHSLPMIIPKFSVIICFIKTGDEVEIHKYDLRIMNGVNKLFDQNFEIEIPQEKRMLRRILVLSGIVIANEGDLTISLTDETEISREFSMVIRKPPESAESVQTTDIE